jgi:hypothetical protein
MESWFEANKYDISFTLYVTLNFLFIEIRHLKKEYSTDNSKHFLISNKNYI